MKPASRAILGVVLAGGSASRMGGADKGEIRLLGKRLIDHVVERIEPQVDTLIIAGPHHYGTPYDAVPDLSDDLLGPVAALHAAAVWIKAQTRPYTHILSVPVDMPLVRRDCCEKLIACGENAFACDNDQDFSALAVWSVESLSWVFNNPGLPNAPSMRWVARQVNASAVAMPSPSGLTNLNTADDVFQLERSLKELG